MIESSRRGFLTGLISFGVTAPAIVRAASIMPVKQMLPSGWQELRYAGDGAFRYYSGYDILVSNEIADLLDRRIEAATEVFAANLRESMDRLIYREGTGASDGLAGLFAAERRKAAG